MGNASVPATDWRRKIVAAAVIVIAVGGTAALFAYTAGWITPERLTPTLIVDALSARGGDPVGHRRNHAKGICFTGYFAANGSGSRLSKAAAFAPGRYPVIGRFAEATGDPRSADASNRVRSMAVRIATPDGEEWRSGMNDSPVFAVATPEAFYEQALAQRIDSATGKPNPAALQRFAAAHPETAGFAQWAHTAAWTASYAEESDNSLNAFRLVDANGKTRTVRWSMQTTEPAHDITPADLAQRGPDLLARELKDRLRQGPLRWRLVITLAAPGDPSDDATKAWPDEREHADVGTLIVEQAQDEASGPCRDLNYDPTILPDGIERSDDPLLAARSAAYANSFDRRTAELARLGVAVYAAGDQP